MPGVNCEFTEPLVLTNGVLASPAPADSGAYEFSRLTCTETGTPSGIMSDDFVPALGDFFKLTFIFYFLIIAVLAFYLGQWIYKR